MATTAGTRSQGTRTIPAHMKPLGYVQVTPVTATGLTPPDGAELALIQAEVQNVRWRDDGTNPTASVGTLLISGQNPVCYFGDLTTIKFIAATAGGLVNVTFYG